MNDFYAITLRVTHPALCHEDIEASLQMSADIGHTVGTPRKTPTGDPLSGVYQRSVASFDLVEKTPGYLVHGVGDVLSLLRPHRDYFSRVVQEGGRVALYVGVFFEVMSGLRLDGELMSLLVEMSIELEVEYFVMP
ncbi:hypothetical protein [Stenotrophomonas sp.]|uniref:hypothetical protein n=1 Tax=Stenotrophomonas sp. TaxID=69392 RepID=UPI002FC70AF8